MTLDINYLKQKLEEEKKLLEKELATLGQKNPDVPGDWEAVPDKENTEQDPDRNTQADHYEELAEKSGIGAELENRLLDVNRALQKIEEKKYGICEISGEQIEEDRLHANPAARTCKKHLNEKM
ncbi:MAG: TraR/DksA C4-type zinc finger protein [bacterium]|nr:TraR/DksA C4-type zinc finger protein [bacterium]